MSDPNLLKESSPPYCPTVAVLAVLLGLKQTVMIFGHDGYGIQKHFGLPRTHVALFAHWAVILKYCPLASYEKLVTFT